MGRFEDSSDEEDDEFGRVAASDTEDWTIPECEAHEDDVSDSASEGGLDVDAMVARARTYDRFAESDDEDEAALESAAKRQKVAVGVPVETVFIAAPTERGKKKKKNRYDANGEWRNLAITEGDWVREDEDGVWRSVPGFPKDAIRVSSEGWVQQWSTKQKAWERPKRGCERKGQYYLEIELHGSHYRVNRLICRAFHGAPPSKAHTTDHEAKRPDGDKRRERQDNRAENLGWATRSRQSENQTRTDAPRADDRPLEVRSEHTRDGWVVGEWTWFQSQGKAAEEMGVCQASMSNWLAYQPCTMGWAVRWAEPAEPQHDLPATDEDPTEVWIKVDDTTSVSNRGRAWKPYRKSEEWRVFTPRATEGTDGYAVITVGGKQGFLFHIVVYDAFNPGERGDLTIDHDNKDRGDNRLTNLKPATASDQSRNQTRKPKGDGLKDSEKTRIQYRRADAPADAPWHECLGAGELARRLFDAEKEPYWDSNISAASNGTYRCKDDRHRYKEYVFYKQA